MTQRDLQLFMPGLTKPLAEWSPSALNSIRNDLSAQALSETRPAALGDIESRVAILEAEWKRREGTLTPDDVAAMRAVGADRPFTERERTAPLLEDQRERDAPPSERAREQSRGAELEP